MNLHNRKIQRLSAQIIFKEETEDLKYLKKLHDEAGQKVMTNLLRDYNLVSKSQMSKNEFKKHKDNPVTVDQ